MADLSGGAELLICKVALVDEAEEVLEDGAGVDMVLESLYKQ